MQRCISKQTRSLLSRALAGALLAIAVVGHARAQAAEKKAFAVPEQPAASGLNDFAAQADVTLVFSPEAVAGIQTQAVTGAYTPEQALQRLLEGTGLAWEKGQGGALAVTVKPVPQAGGASTLDTVVVTGTRIKGGTSASPVITIGSDNIRDEGFADLGQVIRSVPQNFSGGQNPGVASGNLAGAGNANQNITGGSSLNLRGLGPDATLTLLNGRRMSYSGFVQSVDISAIPVEAVERLEIVADGASAIYGSDAVGGVGNVILQRDFDGVTVGTRYGGATDGGLATREYTLTAGTTWSTGGLLATYKDASSDPILASQRSYTDHLISPTTIYPGSDLRSALVSAHQALGERAELRLDALRSRRDQTYVYYYGGINRIASQTTSTLASPGIDVFLPGDWTLTLDATWARDESQQYQGRQSASTGTTTVVTDACFCNESRSYGVGVEGPLFAMAGGEARLAAGAGYRTNAFVWENHSTGADTAHGDEGVRFAYAEANLPFIGPEQGITGARRLVLTAAVRAEDYDSFGRVTTPKFGLLYGPSADFTIKASWGKSFKAPTLFERYYPQSLLLYVPGYFGGSGYASDATVLYLSGGNADLKPERARTWTASLAFHPEALPGLEAEATWFDIDYTDRVIQPIGNATQSLGNSTYDNFISYAPSESEQAGVIAGVDTFSNWTGAAYDPSKVVAILYAQYQNVSRQRIKGLDLSGSYRIALGAGQLTLHGSSTWLDSSQQNTTAQAYSDLSGTLFNPAKLTGRVGAVWSLGGFSASAFVNYTDGVEDTSAHQKTASFTTFDGTLRYSTGARADAWSGLAITLSGQNLFNRAPPLYSPALAAYAAPYDSTNYSAVGRYLSLAVSKHW